MILGKYAFQSVTRILEDIKVTKGIDAVKSWCLDYGTDLKHCNTCDEKTPCLQTTTEAKCAICNSTVQLNLN